MLQGASAPLGHSEDDLPVAHRRGRYLDSLDRDRVTVGNVDYDVPLGGALARYNFSNPKSKELPKIDDPVVGSGRPLVRVGDGNGTESGHSFSIVRRDHEPGRSTRAAHNVARSELLHLTSSHACLLSEIVRIKIPIPN